MSAEAMTISTRSACGSTDAQSFDAMSSTANGLSSSSISSTSPGWSWTACGSTPGAATTSFPAAPSSRPFLAGSCSPYGRRLPQRGHRIDPTSWRFA
jgi:hypothetical protein